MIQVTGKISCCTHEKTASKEDLSCILGVLFERTVGTLKFVDVGQLVKSISTDDMSTNKSHGWIRLTTLCSEYRTGKNTVKVFFLSQLNLDGQLVLGRPDCRDFSLLHHFPVFFMKRKWINYVQRPQHLKTNNKPDVQKSREGNSSSIEGHFDWRLDRKP